MGVSTLDVAVEPYADQFVDRNLCLLYRNWVEERMHQGSHFNF